MQEFLDNNKRLLLAVLGAVAVFFQSKLGITLTAEQLLAFVGLIVSYIAASKAGTLKKIAADAGAKKAEEVKTMEDAVNAIKTGGK